MVGRRQVELGEELGTTHALKDVVDEGQRRAVLDGHRVQPAVVHAHAQLAPLLWHKHDRRSRRRCRHANETLLDEVLYLCDHLVALALRERVNGRKRRLRARHEVDLAIVRAVRW